MTAPEMVTVPREDLAMLLWTIALAHCHARVAAEIVHDVIPLRDLAGELNMTARQIRYLAVGIEEELDGCHEGLLSMMERIGMNYDQVASHYGG
jgi:hypothetical protein